MKIRARGEDRPMIAVDKRGQIMVTFAADARQPWTSYFSFSSDGGQHFSKPVPVSDQARANKQLQTKLSVAPDGRIYLFWLDERDKVHPDRSLYFATSAAVTRTTLASHNIHAPMCDCCRIAVDFDGHGMPVLATRFIFTGGVRDHGLIEMAPNGARSEPRRVTFDEWKINACPEHGPALSIANGSRYHLTWFTQGSARQGLFYARSGDQGQHFTTPMTLGESGTLASHGDVLAEGSRVVLVWQEYDGKTTQIRMRDSNNGGDPFAPPRTLGQTTGVADHPFLINDQKRIFLSWSNHDGHQILRLE